MAIWSADRKRTGRNRELPPSSLLAIAAELSELVGPMKKSVILVDPRGKAVRVSVAIIGMGTKRKSDR